MKKILILLLCFCITFAACTPQNKENTLDANQTASANVSGRGAQYSKHGFGDNSSNLGYTFIDAELPGTSVYAKFMLPEYLNWEIFDILYDIKNDKYAILYAVSSYNGDMPWLTYQDEEGRVHIQIFDAEGSLLNHIETDICPPVNSASEVVAYPPGVFDDNLITFFSGWISTEYIFYNVAEQSYRAVPATICVNDGEYYLTANNEFSFTNVVELTLFLGSDEVAHMEIPVDDLGLIFPDNRSYVQGENHQNNLSFDKNTKIAQYGNDKIVYTIDFNNLSWSMERFYTKEHLEEILAQSADGQWQIYSADSGGAGDGWWYDVVAYNTATEVITFLSKDAGTVIFAKDNQILLNQTSKLELIDVENAKVINSNFAIDCEEKDCFVVGTAYDSTRECFLVAWRAPQQGISGDNAREIQLPIMLDLYDLNGELIKSIDTGLETPAFHKNYVIALNLVITESGKVRITSTSGLANIGGMVEY